MRDNTRRSSKTTGGIRPRIPNGGNLRKGAIFTVGDLGTTLKSLRGTNFRLTLSTTEVNQIEE
jgi:hypothetical protein